MAAAVGNAASAKAKAASICFDLAEYYRKHRQFDKVNSDLWRHACLLCVTAPLAWKAKRAYRDVCIQRLY
jgi:hypothetical protein